MSSIGFKTQCKPNGTIVIDGLDKMDDSKKKPSKLGYVSSNRYCNNWTKNFPQLKVSRPAEDICQYCFVFANRHRYFANHTPSGTIGDDQDCDNNDPVSDVIIVGNPPVNIIELPESATTQAEEARELMVMESAKHIRMARAQRALYQALVADAVSDAKEEKDHGARRYTFVVDYGQNMEIPIFNDEQPGCTYYYSPLSVYNLGVVNHAHMYENGDVRKHMYCHVYNEGVGKKGANNVASLIVKTLRQLNLLQEDLAGGELNIVFDNCSGQNKNNTVLKLAAWLKQMGYFKKVNFVFLVVGHTKNAADSSFNSLKVEYRRENIYTMHIPTLGCVGFCHSCAYYARGFFEL